MNHTTYIYCGTISFKKSDLDFHASGQFHHFDLIKINKTDGVRISRSEYNISCALHTCKKVNIMKTVVFSTAIKGLFYLKEKKTYVI